MAVAKPKQAIYERSENWVEELDPRLREAAWTASQKFVESMKAHFEAEDKLGEKELAKSINLMHKEGVEGFKIKIGALLLENLFDGDITKALSKDPTKHDSFEKFSNRSDLEVDPRTLVRWTQAAAVFKECIDKNVSTGDLGLSHLSAIATIGKEDDRLNLVKKAVSSRLTVGGIREEINKLRESKVKSAQREITAENFTYRDLKRRLSNPRQAVADKGLMKLLSNEELLLEKLTPNEFYTVFQLVKKLTEAMEEDLKKFEDKEAEIKREKEPFEKNLEGLQKIREKFKEIVVK